MKCSTDRGVLSASACILQRTSRHRHKNLEAKLRGSAETKAYPQALLFDRPQIHLGPLFDRCVA